MASLRGILVVTEVALALILLTGSALMVQSMVRLLTVDTGLRTDHVLTGELTLPKAQYGSEDAQQIFLQRLLESLQAQSQFSGVALTNTTILSGLNSLIVFDPSSMGINEEETNLEAITVTPGFLKPWAFAFSADASSSMTSKALRRWSSSMNRWRAGFFPDRNRLAGC
jgi:hypothetical protein